MIDINVILIIGIIQYFFYYFNKSKSNILGCGIIGWAGKSVNKFNKAKLDLLGTYNEDRGTDSCGISVDGDIFIGVGETKVYRDFISEIGYLNPVSIPTVIGHTRKSTFGAHTAENAHPFGFGGGNDGIPYRLIGVHNGTLLNHEKLAEQFKVSLKQEINYKKNRIKSREKIDSEILLECIYKTKSYKPLNKYNGAAALVWIDTTKPNTIYCYHGACKKYSYDPEDKIYEERPLYYYKETRNSIYISSIKESLFAIGGNKDTVFEFDFNTVYEITDGNIDKAIKTRITRTKCYMLKSYMDHKYSDYTDDGLPVIYDKNGQSKFRLDGTLTDDIEDNFHMYQGDIKPLIKDLNISSFPEGNNCDIPFVNNASEFRTSNIYSEFPPSVPYNNSIYFHKLRYWKDSKLLTGCCVWIPKFGFYYLGKDYGKANDDFYKLVNKPFYKNDFILTNKEYNEKESFIAFPHGGEYKEYTHAPLFYFVKGARVQTVSDYIASQNMEKNGQDFSWESLTYCSTHPLIDLTFFKRDYLIQTIKLEGKLFSGIISPLGSNKIYTINDGNCVKIEKAFETTKPVTQIKNSLEEVADILTKEEEKKTEKENEVNNINNDIIDNRINDIFMLPYQKFPHDIKRLEKFNHLPRVKEAISILEEFMSKATTIVAIEQKE